MDTRPCRSIEFEVGGSETDISARIIRILCQYQDDLLVSNYRTVTRKIWVAP